MIGVIFVRPKVFSIISTYPSLSGVARLYLKSASGSFALLTPSRTTNCGGWLYPWPYDVIPTALRPDSASILIIWGNLDCGLNVKSYW